MIITLNHIRELSSVELKILSYMSITGTIQELSQKELAKEINCSDRQVRSALKSLEDRGIISYNRTPLSKEKSIVMVH